MDDRIIEFVRGMRAAGVRVSMAESMDAMRAVEVLGVADKELFRQSMRVTLVKESEDFAVFEELFPLYFGSGGPAMQNATEARGRRKRSWRRWPSGPASSGTTTPRRRAGSRDACCSRWAWPTWRSNCAS